MATYHPEADNIRSVNFYVMDKEYARFFKDCFEHEYSDAQLRERVYELMNAIIRGNSTSPIVERARLEREIS